MVLDLVRVSFISIITNPYIVFDDPRKSSSEDIPAEMHAWRHGRVLTMSYEEMTYNT